MMLELELRRLELADLDAIERIERVSYSDALVALDVRVGARQAELALVRRRRRDRHARRLPRPLALRRRVARDERRGRPERRRQGIASALLQRLLELTKDDALRGYTLEVRVSNVGAISLYERFGFVPKGLRRGYYTDNREDALIMWRDAERPPERRSR